MNFFTKLLNRFGPKITVKTYLFTLLLILYLLALIYTKLETVWFQTFLAVTTAVILDLALNWYRKRSFFLPDSAIISAFIIIMILAVSQPWYIPVFAASCAILSKHFIEIKNRHIFNPANLAIFSSIYLFGTYDEWWGASNIYVLILGGLFVMGKLRRVYLPGIFLLTFLLLLFISGPADFLTSAVSNYALFFFAFIMLPEPQTSPLKTQSRIIFAIMTASLAFIFYSLGIRSYFVTALLLANGFVPLMNYFTNNTEADEN